MRWRWIVHNCVAHPLLVFCPPLGRFLHGCTAGFIDAVPRRVPPQGDAK